MKTLDSRICGFSWACVVAAGITAFLIGWYVCKETPDLNIAIVTACVITLMLGIILIVLLLMEKQILPETIHNENIHHEMMAKLIYDSRIKEKCKEICDGFKTDMDTVIAAKIKELENELSKYRRTIEESKPDGRSKI